MCLQTKKRTKLLLVSKDNNRKEVLGLDNFLLAFAQQKYKVGSQLKKAPFKDSNIACDASSNIEIL